MSSPERRAAWAQALAACIAQSPDHELIALSSAPDAPIPGGARLRVDLADAKAVEEVFDRVEQRIRGKRYAKAVLINNAGIVTPGGPSRIGGPRGARAQLRREPRGAAAADAPLPARD